MEAEELKKEVASMYECGDVHSGFDLEDCLPEDVITPSSTLEVCENIWFDDDICDDGIIGTRFPSGLCSESMDCVNWYDAPEFIGVAGVTEVKPIKDKL